MVDSLAAIRSEIADKIPLLLIIGRDRFNGLARWHREQSLFDYVHIVVMRRPRFKADFSADFYVDKYVDKRQSLKSSASGKIYFQQVTQ